MSFFDRVFRPEKWFSAKLNATNQRPAFLRLGDSTTASGATRPHNDNVHPHQPLSIFYQKTNFENLDHRDWQSKHNSHLNKLTQGVANFLLQKTPYPFMYAEVSLDESNTEENISETENEINKENETDAKTETKTVRKVSTNDSTKSNSLQQGQFGQDPQREQFPLQDEGVGLFGQAKTSQDLEYYSLRRDLMDQYMPLWLERDAYHQNMFYIIRKCVHKGLATQCAAIVRRRVKGKDLYFVFGSNQIVETKGTSRLVEKIKVRWSSWSTHTDTSHKNTDKQGDQWFTVGEDCVFYVPFPCEESPRGTSFLQSVWDLGIWQQQNRYMQSLYLWNGFQSEKIVRMPNTTEDSVRDQVEDHMKAPWLKPGMIITFPPGANPEHIDKMFQFETSNSNEPAWDIHNEIYNQDSPFPKMFLEGQVESGALGGSAPEVDQEEQDKAMLQWFHIIDPLVKMINETFFGADPDEFTNVSIIPFMGDLISRGSTPKNMSTRERESEPQTEEKEEEDKPIDVKRLKTTKTNSIKANSLTAQGATYIGNLFAEGWLPQDDGNPEWLDRKTIKEFVESPSTVKEGFFKLDDHPSDDPMKVDPLNSHGKYKVIGYDEKKGRDITEFIIFDSDPPEEIDVSPAYYSQDITRSDGSIEQTNISVVNAVATKSPRSLGKTKAIKVK